MKPVTVTGVVKHGKQLGRTLGFPTINLELESSSTLAYGVYASQVQVAGSTYLGMTNVGCHPTLPEGSATIETYIIGVNLDLYDKPVTVTLIEFIRPEKRFESVRALINQLEKDKATIIESFS